MDATYVKQPSCEGQSDSPLWCLVFRVSAQLLTRLTHDQFRGSFGSLVSQTDVPRLPSRQCRTSESKVHHGHIPPSARGRGMSMLELLSGLLVCAASNVILVASMQLLRSTRGRISLIAVITVRLDLPRTLPSHSISALGGRPYRLLLALRDKSIIRLHSSQACDPKLSYR